MRLAAACLMAVAAHAVAGCQAGGGQPAAADCAQQLRLDDRIYTGVGYTDRAATRFGVADEAECHDVGKDAAGSVFPDDPRQVTVWSFADYDPADVLGVRFDDDSFAVFVAEPVPRPDLDRIVGELSGSGELQPGAEGALPAERSYNGPLYLTRDEAAHPTAGAAGDAVECDHWGAGGFEDQEVYSEGATADSPGEALEVARSEQGLDGFYDGLVIAETEADRVLYVGEVDGKRKQAVIVRDGPATEGAGGPGWYVESWARCDLVELPRSYTDSLGLQIWTDDSGKPVPTSRLESWRGSEHCAWQGMTFLQVHESGDSRSDRDDPSYVRDPLPELGEWFADPFLASMPLPDDAEPTGYRRDGAELWLSPDRDYVYVGRPGDVEAWPVTIRPLGCA